MSPLKWTCLSLRNLAETLQKKGYDISRNIVGKILHSLNYSLQANAKRFEDGADRPERNEQFEYINSRVKSFLRAKNPVISVDTKKKELIGEYKNGGRELRPKGKPDEVKMHDFIDPAFPKAAPYGIYDIGKNLGHVNVGISSDTAIFAVESIRQWWNNMGYEMYNNSKQLLICADSGGSNGYRSRLWKIELQKFANEIGINITVCHFPPGTSKWNKIEHRLFSHITMNWRGKPLRSYVTIVKLIGATQTRKGLRVVARLDENLYEKGIKVAKKEMDLINLRKHKFHGDWNYTIVSL
jgi:hypothetical protein